MVRNDVQVGRVGRVHPTLLERIGLAADTLVFEFDLTPLMAPALPAFAGFSALPAVRRDLALLVPRDLPAAALEAAVREVLGARLVHFTFFDVYAGEGIDSEKKSLGLGLTLQDPSRTLEEAEVGAAMATVLEVLGTHFGARLR